MKNRAVWRDETQELKKKKKENLQTFASAVEDNASSRIWIRFADALSLGRENAH